MYNGRGILNFFILRTAMRKLIWLGLVLYLVSSLSHAATASAIQLDITGAIGPATQDYIQRGINYAAEHGAKLVILRLDTPGGLETAMRGIDKAILASPVPVVTYVAPAGARAASAGTFILYASHIAAMAPGTNVGAASPVSIGGIPNPVSEDEKKKDSSTMEKKVTNDAVAYIRSLAELRGRNVAWAEQAVRSAVSLPAEEALKLKVIDLEANSIPELLARINGLTVQLQNGKQVLQTKDLTVESYESDWRFRFLSIITDPSVAYILLLIGIYGLFFEFANPGFVLPGVAGVISLLLALYAFQLLPINYVGFALLLLGIAFMIIEAFISSFGILGIGGVIAFAAGSILLLDTGTPGFSIAWWLILFMSLISIGFFLLIASLAIRSQKKKIVSGREALIGMEGEVLEYMDKQLMVRIQGEIWQAHADKVLHPGQRIRITKVSGLLLTVEPTE